MKAKQAVSFYALQEKWLLACADFDHAKKGPKQRTALGKMQRVLRSIQTGHPREIAAYRTAYERRLEKMAGVKLPRIEDAPRAREPRPRKKPTKKR